LGILTPVFVFVSVPLPAAADSRAAIIAIRRVFHARGIFVLTPELPTRQNNEYEVMFDPQPPFSHGLSLADATRKFDEILKRADQRTDEEKKFREDYGGPAKVCM
jgi:hypothetical protein